ncbi:LBP_cg2779 family protein [Lacticaseibacillus zhaodongensis]|uniref:LBP_cg2779 family protein n=1 Tax=Lacticaseibacillus zhaodongensis TaxID=2668065 RepID=UPI0012D32EBB|nr:LBP_cg2779 family protein [Lacticaseibacillus zhaodongensis]
MSEKNDVNDFAREIIEFQKRNDLTDTDMALNSHVSVEHIHNIKAMREVPEPDIVSSLRDYMLHKPNGK